MHLDVVLLSLLLCWHLQKAFQVIILGVGWGGGSGLLLQLKLLLPQHTHIFAPGNWEGGVWKVMRDRAGCRRWHTRLTSRRTGGISI